METLSLLLTSELKWKSRYFCRGFSKEFTLLAGTDIQKGPCRAGDYSYW